MSSRLSPDLINQITPILGSIARLINKFGKVTESQLRLLIEAENLTDDPEILEEVSRWAHLLEKVYQSPNFEIREAVIESLRQRGIAEAPAMLAVSEVADAVKQKSPDSDTTRHLGASTTNIDFGLLPVGETAVRELEVYGGPGQVFFDNQSIDVNPMQFDAEPTTLRVRVRPPINDEIVFHDQLALKNQIGELLNINVTAQWQKLTILYDEEIGDSQLDSVSGQVSGSKPAVGVPVRRYTIPWLGGRAGLAILGSAVVVLILITLIFEGKNIPTQRVEPTLVGTKVISSVVTTIQTMTQSVIAQQVSPAETQIQITNNPNDIREENELNKTPSEKPPPTRYPTSISSDTKVNPKDSVILILIPAGKFIMGSNPEEDPYWYGAEYPSHLVYLDSYWIYKTEVTNAMYRICVEEKKCPKPAYEFSATRPDYFNNAQFNDYPVINVSWHDALAYCQWAGGSLPTEAEWEKAARGTDERFFAWGNNPPSGSHVNYCDFNCPDDLRDTSQNDGFRDTAPVGAYPDGASPYGVLDMAGNVWEWTMDWFDQTYYKSSPQENPLGPSSGERRVVRGGSWYNPVSGVRTVNRRSERPNKTMDTLGFRCVIK